MGQMVDSVLHLGIVALRDNLGAGGLQGTPSGIGGIIRYRGHLVVFRKLSVQGFEKKTLTVDPSPQIRHF